jgi:adenylate kinase family enzyme
MSREISKQYGIPYYELDNLVWDRSVENLKYSEEIRDEKLIHIINTKFWIIEGVHYKWTFESFMQADLIFILNPNVFLRDFRIIKRFIRSKTGIEQWNYKQSFKNLIKMMIKWNHGFSLTEILEKTNDIKEKRFIIKNKEEMLGHIQDFFKMNEGCL